MQVKNVPMVFDIEDNYWEKIFIENARFENISGPAFNIAVENNSNNSITLRDVWCSDVPVLAAFSGFGTPVAVLESSKGSDDNILNGIGISTGAFNYRAVGLKWRPDPALTSMMSNSSAGTAQCGNRLPVRRLQGGVGARAR